MAGESAGLSIPWEDPAMAGDEFNIYVHQGERIDVDTSAEADEAMKAAQRIYADAGHTMDEGDLRQLRGRILGGQSLAEIVANTYDEAARRFTEDGGGGETVSEPSSPDSQLNIGRTYEPPQVMLEQLVTPAREVADLQDEWPGANVQQNPLSNTRTNWGPSPNFYGPGGGMVVAEGGAAAGGSEFPWGLVLIGAAVLVGGYFLLRKKK